MFVPSVRKNFRFDFPRRILGRISTTVPLGDRLKDHELRSLNLRHAIVDVERKINWKSYAPGGWVYPPPWPSPVREWYRAGVFRNVWKRFPRPFLLLFSHFFFFYICDVRKTDSLLTLARGQNGRCRWRGRLAYYQMAWLLAAGLVIASSPSRNSETAV